jgi:hypothetical protein
VSGNRSREEHLEAVRAWAAQLTDAPTGPEYERWRKRFNERAKRDGKRLIPSAQQARRTFSGLSMEELHAVAFQDADPIVELCRDRVLRDLGTEYNPLGIVSSSGAAALARYTVHQFQSEPDGRTPTRPSP